MHYLSFMMPVLFRGFCEHRLRFVVRRFLNVAPQRPTFYISSLFLLSIPHSFSLFFLFWFYLFFKIPLHTQNPPFERANINSVSFTYFVSTLKSGPVGLGERGEAAFDPWARVYVTKQNGLAIFLVTFF